VINALYWLKENKNLLRNNTKVTFYLDSELVVRQISGVYRVKSENLKPLIKKVRSLLKELKIEGEFFSVPREKNEIADLLVNMKIDENIG
jgi:ribonuclease HI